MQIDYYSIDWSYNRITDHKIHKENPDLVSYTCDSVTITETLETFQGETLVEPVTHPRSFDAAKKELAEVFKKSIVFYQQKLSNLENSTDYERYSAVKYL